MASGERTNWQRVSASCLTTQQVRRVDRLAIEKFGMHSLVLMENAALGCVRWLENRFQDSPRPRTVILCGTGNNGGDGLAIARHLRCLGWPCCVVVSGALEKLSEDARANAGILTAGNAQAIQWWSAEPGGSQEIMDDIEHAELIIDAMLGTGAKGNPRCPFDDWIVASNKNSAVRVAIDNPTGLDADYGQRFTPCFEGHATLTFVARKPGMLLAEGIQACGEIFVLPIGVPDQLLAEFVPEVA